jgi:hypothetical protein
MNKPLEITLLPQQTQQQKSQLSLMMVAEVLRVAKLTSGE